VLEKLSRSQTAAHRDVQRGKALLMASDGFATTRIAKEIGASPATVTRWRECFEQDGLKRQ
jgi:transposase-like protein